MKRTLIVVLLLLLLAVTAVGVFARTAPTWNDTQDVIRPGDRLYVYCAGGHQVVKERPNVVIVTCHAIGEDTQ
jgi:hypothetical protein